MIWRLKILCLHAGLIFGIALACDWYNLSERSEQLVKWMGM